MLILAPLGNIVQLGLELGRRSVPILLASLVGLGGSTGTKEPIVISGMGTLGCGKLLEQIAPNEGYAQSKLSLAAFSWVQGYLSALNIIAMSQAGVFADLRTISEDEQWTNIMDFCRRNPEGFVIDAAQEIVTTKLRVEIAFPQPK
jgi:hypothetical protein